ncbi:F0F1 ATP synthase subunit B family protein [Croceicoccus naphthovorans]|uniref:ATP synthase subunit b n=1 Tax=Croceicoccus naphthovorans TaxID=1348774 RepID=A0A0G3XGC0_9SPHN|nr:ATP synthase subunit B [Croceicoccus naphthovorans]AKM09681.1 ATP synthase subunit B [Croceicoccus naphthovorans]MBB3990809.1 F-type H+-transporting ATPase subunit b [Croceicoccus naphthovorans]
MSGFLTVLAATDGSAVVEEHLDNADHLEGLEEDHGGEHAVPVAFGFIGPTAWVSLAMLTFIAILLWKGVPKLITGGLDKKIAEIKSQLDEAKTLRAEAEALRKEYADKIANAEKDAAAMLEHARSEADAIVAKAETDGKAMVERRKKMAEEKIAASERAAVEELRERAARASAAAAGAIIAEKHDASADGALVDRTISAL